MDYRGEIIAKMKSTTDAVPTIYNIGEPFVQLVIVPYLNKVTAEFADNLTETDRGNRGFGEATQEKLNNEQNTQNNE